MLPYLGEKSAQTRRGIRTLALGRGTPILFRLHPCLDPRHWAEPWRILFSLAPQKHVTQEQPLQRLLLKMRASLMAQLVKNRLQCRRPWFDSWVGKICWRRERLPTPVLQPGEFRGHCMVHRVAKSQTWMHSWRQVLPGLEILCQTFSQGF